MASRLPTNAPRHLPRAPGLLHEAGKDHGVPGIPEEARPGQVPLVERGVRSEAPAELRRRDATDPGGGDDLSFVFPF